MGTDQPASNTCLHLKRCLHVSFAPTLQNLKREALNQPLGVLLTCMRATLALKYVLCLSLLGLRSMQDPLSMLFVRSCVCLFRKTSPCKFLQLAMTLYCFTIISRWQFCYYSKVFLQCYLWSFQNQRCCIFRNSMIATKLSLKLKLYCQDFPLWMELNRCMLKFTFLVEF